MFSLKFDGFAVLLEPRGDFALSNAAARALFAVSSAVGCAGWVGSVSVGGGCDESNSPPTTPISTALGGASGGGGGGLVNWGFERVNDGGGGGGSILEGKWRSVRVFSLCCFLFGVADPERSRIANGCGRRALGFRLNGV